MLLTCPQCETQFAAPDELILPDGKTVRCSICKHSWFQEPITEEPEENTETEEDQGKAESEDIPEALKEGPAEIETPKPAKNILSKIPLSLSQESIAGIAASFVVFILLFGIFAMLRAPLTHAMPATNGFYAMLGMGPKAIGKSITFHAIHATRTGDKLQITGEVGNLDTKSSKLPAIKAQQIGAHDKVLQSWIIKAPARNPRRSAI